MSHPLEETITLLGGDAVLSPVGPFVGRFNKQLYENSADAGCVEEASLGGLDAFRGARLPNLVILHEQPWHRAVCYMRAQGATLQEIASRFGKTVPWISQLCRQPWFQQRVIQELKETGRGELEHLLEVQALPSVEKLVELRDGASSEQVQLKAAQDLVDRFCGKATQRVETKSDINYRTVTEDAAKLDKEIESLHEQLGILRSPQAN